MAIRIRVPMHIYTRFWENLSEKVENVKKLMQRRVYIKLFGSAHEFRTRSPEVALQYFQLAYCLKTINYLFLFCCNKLPRICYLKFRANF